MIVHLRLPLALLARLGRSIDHREPQTGLWNFRRLSGASGKCLVELGKPYKETCDGDQVEKVDSGRAIGA